jgi:hypothetical protein
MTGITTAMLLLCAGAACAQPALPTVVWAIPVIQLAPYLQQCQTSSGVVWTCNKTSNCAVAADWVPVTGYMASGTTDPATCLVGQAVREHFG